MRIQEANRADSDGERIPEGVSEAISSKEVSAESLRRVEKISEEWVATVDALVDLVFLVDAGGRVLRANRALERWGVDSVFRVAGKDFHELIHPGCNGRNCYVMDQWNRVWSPLKSQELADVEARDDFLQRRVHLAIRPVKGKGDSEGMGDSFATVVLRDCSAAYEAQLKDSRRGQFEAVSSLVRGLAHEIGNPLAATKTSVQVLIRNFEEFDKEKKHLYLERILDGAERLQAIVDKVLQGHQWRIEEKRPIRLDHLLESVRSLFEDEVRELGIELSVTPPEDPSLTLLGDSTAVEEVLVNTMTNAIEACRNGDRIAVGCVRTGDTVLVSVQDSGCGISRSDLRRIFHPFFTTKPQGSGFGLALSDHLMQEMGGMIQIQSKEGQGTVAILSFEAGADGKEGSLGSDSAIEHS